MMEAGAKPEIIQQDKLMTQNTSKKEFIAYEGNVVTKGKGNKDKATSSGEYHKLVSCI